ncbi:MAG: phosphotransferase [Cyanobacteriota bacterium]|nr:phosphotransferase [Cyanobacteriota bacterium]
MPADGPAPDHLIAGRYRLDQCLSDGSQGQLWRATDQLAAQAPVVLRRLTDPVDLPRAAGLWTRLQGVLHPQVPRLGSAIEEGATLWLVREWQSGRTYRQLLAARAERQLVFGAGEVLLLLRQLLPVLTVLHGQDLVHGDLCPANLLRRDSDGLPVLLDFGLVCGEALATAGYAPPALAAGTPPQPWMDLHALGVTALVLISGDPPEKLLDPVTLDWSWPPALAGLPELRALLARLIGLDGTSRFSSAAQALAAAQQVPMPDSTGPVPRTDRTAVLVPRESPEPPSLPPLASVPVAASDPSPRSRALERDEAAEGGLWSVVIALVLSAVVGTALGWWWLSRGRPVGSNPESALQLPSSLPSAEIDQRQQLLNRLRAMQVDRAWFLSLVDASLLAQFPERGNRLPTDSPGDAPLRKVWNELAEEWLSRVEQLPVQIRRRLGSYQQLDWQNRQQVLVKQGLSPRVLRQLVSDGAQNLLPGSSGSDIPPEPFRQLWFAAAERSLAHVQIEALSAVPLETQVLSAPVEAGGARLFPIRLQPDHRLVLGVNGSPLMQMSVFSADGELLDGKGPLRVVSLGAQKRSPVQLLITNDGLAPAQITLSLRADPPPAPTAPAPLPEPEPPQGPSAATDLSGPAPAPEAGNPE